MNITPFELYVILKLDSICSIGHFFAMTGGILCILFFCVAVATLDCKESLWKTHTRAMVIGLVSIALWVSLGAGILVVVPTTKQMATIIVAPKIINSVANNEELKKIPNNLLKLANEWVEEQIPKKDED